MPDSIFSKSSSSSRPKSIFSTSKKKKQKKKGGFLGAVGGLVSNAADEVSTAVIGAPAAAKAAAEAVAGDVGEILHPRPRQGQKKKPFPRTTEIATQIAKSYADYYGPLVHGDVEGFLQNVYDQPLSFTLDVATVGSLGLGGFAKVGIISAKGGKVLELTDSAGNVVRTKPLAKSELRARLQGMTAQARNKEIRVRGKTVRQGGQEAARVRAGQIRQGVRNKQAPVHRYNKAVDRLSPKQRLAVALRMQYDREALNAEIARLRKLAKNDPDGPAAQNLAVLTDRKTQRFFDKPTKKMQEVIAIGREVGERGRQILNIEEATAEARRFLPARIAHGAEFVSDPSVKPTKGNRVRLDDGTTGKVSHVYDDGTAIEVRVAKGGGRTVTKGIDEVENLDAPRVLVGGPSIDELKARGLEPAYLPDLAELPDRPTMDVGGTGGGLGIPQRVGATRQNRGILRNLGQVVHDPATLSVSFGKAIRFHHYTQVHDELMGMAVESAFVPKGYKVVRRRSSERVPHTVKTRAQFDEWASKHLDEDGNIKSDVDFTTDVGDPDAMLGPNGGYMVVPDQVAKQLTGEFKRAGAFTRLLDKGPMRVWRALTLGLTPRWLVNNVVGNSLMYSLRYGSPREIAQIAGAFRDMIHPKDFGEFDRLLEKHFAGQLHGGFQATQYPSFRSQNRIVRAGAAVAGFLPKFDRRFEQALRKRAVINELKRNPQLRPLVEQMGRDTAAFDAAATNPAALTDDLSRLDSPARNDFAKEMEARYAPDEAEDVMALTDLLAAYSARNKGIPMEQAYDDLVKGVTGAEAEAGALAQAPVRPARIDEPPLSPEHGDTLKFLDEAWTRHNAAEEKWTAAGRPKTGPIKKEKDAAKRLYEAARVDELHQRMWDQRSLTRSTEHVAERQKVMDELREKLGERSGAWPRRFQTDEGALEMFDFLDDLAARGEAARFWYRDSGRAILRFFDGDKAEAAKFAQLVAIYSPQQAVVGNLGLAMRAYEAFQRGEKIPVGQTWQKAATERVLKGTGGWDGRKTNNFYGNLLQHIDKKKFREEGFTGNEVTSDMWMARVFGYLTDQVSEGRYDLIEDVVRQLAKERGWRPQEVQAAVWTAVKQADLDDISANIDFAGAVERNLHTVNLEVTKGITGIGEDLTFEQTAQVIRDVAPAIEQAARDHNLTIRRRDFGEGGAEDIRVGPAAYETGRNAASYFEVAGSPDSVQAFVNHLAEGFDQWDVWATREGTTGGGKGTLVIKSKKLSDPEVADRFFAALHEEMGSKAAGFAMVRDMDGIQIIAPGTVSRAGLDDFAQSYADAIAKAEKAAGIKVKYHATQTSVIKKKEAKSGRVRGSEGAAGGRAGTLAAGDPAALRAALDDAVQRARGGEGGTGGAVPGRAGGVPEPDARGGLNRDYSPDKFTPEAEARKAESRSFIEERKHLQQDTRGAFDPSTQLIHLFDDADPSTAIHEFVHAVDTGGGFTDEHISVLESWSGTRYGSREFSEAAAQGFELYLREGRAPNAALANVFARWKVLLTRIYRKATQLGRPISDEVRAVFDDILTPPQHVPKGPLDQLDQALMRDPHFVYEVYDRVNDALGNYDHMTTFEKNVIRNLFPFWGWYKAITGVGVKLTLDHPLAVNLMSKLADIAIEAELASVGIDPENVPESLLGLIPTGIDDDGRVRGINTAGVNPFATIGQLADFIQATVNLHPGEIGAKAPGLNPYLAYLASLYTGQTPLGYDVQGFAPVEGLPQFRLLKALEAQYGDRIPGVRPAATKDPLYDHDIVDELLRYFGLPYVRASKTAAERVAEKSNR